MLDYQAPLKSRYALAEPYTHMKMVFLERGILAHCHQIQSICQYKECLVGLRELYGTVERHSVCRLETQMRNNVQPTLNQLRKMKDK
jgi:hypothetical protein